APADATMRRRMRGPTEVLIGQLFSEALGVEAVEPSDDFFALGGHSLLAARLVKQLNATLGVQLSIRTLFEHRTVAALAAEIAAGRPAPTPFPPVLPLRATGARVPLICLPPGGGLGWSYAGLLSTLLADRPLYALQVAGISTGRFATSIESFA